MITTFYTPIGEENKRDRKRKLQKSINKMLMVVAILFAVVEFQAIMTSLGGIWQGDIDDNKNHRAHFVGKSVMANRNHMSINISKHVRQ